METIEISIEPGDRQRDHELEPNHEEYQSKLREDAIEQSNNYVMERLIASRKTASGTKYRVRWYGYD